MMSAYSPATAAQPAARWRVPGILGLRPVRVATANDRDAQLADIGAQAMRMRLYRGLTVGAKIDALKTSRDWTGLWLKYAMGGFFKEKERLGKIEESMVLANGYPPFLSRVDTRGKTFRIFCPSAESAEAIRRESSLLPAFYGYVEKAGPMRTDYPDLTGVFITIPGASPSSVGVPDYKHYVDFQLPDEVGLVGVGYKHPDIFLIPGPARIRDWMIAQAREIIAGRRPADPAIADVVEIVRKFGDKIPEYRIPIRILGAPSK